MQQNHKFHGIREYRCKGNLMEQPAGRRIRNMWPVWGEHGVTQGVLICPHLSPLSAITQRSFYCQPQHLGKQQSWAMQTDILRTKSTFKNLFWCFSLSQIEDSSQYLEGPISTWKDHNTSIGIFLLLDPIFLSWSNIDIVVLPGTDWSFQVLTRVPYF